MFKTESIELDEYINREDEREISASEYSAARLGQTFDEATTLGPVLNEMKVGWEALKEMSSKEHPSGYQSMEDRIHARRRGEDVEIQESSSLEVISQEEFNEKNMGENGLGWYEGMTKVRANVEAETSKTMAIRKSVLERGSTPAREVYGFGLDLIANMADPVNYIGVGPAMKIGTTIARKALISGTIAAAENLAVSAVTRPYWQERGIESTWQDYAMDGVVGFGMGGLIGGVAGKWQSMNARKEITQKSKETLAKVISNTAEQIRNGEKPDPTIIPGFKEAVDEVMSLPSKVSKDIINRNSDRIVEALGVSGDDARAQQVPMVLNMMFKARELGEDPAELVTSFIIKTAKETKSKASNIEFKVDAETKGDFSRIESKLIDDTINDMALEVNAAEPGQRSGVNIINPKDGEGYLKNVNTSTKSTFPKWYKEAGVKNKEHFQKVIEAKKGPVWSRIKKIAEDRLENGGRDGEGIPVEPSNEWRKLKGQEPIVLNQDSNLLRESGTVLEFDGTEGVIKLDNGETVYFDDDSIRKGRSLPGIGEKVEISLGGDKDFPTTDTLYHSKSRRDAELQTRQSEYKIPEDFEVTKIAKGESFPQRSKDIQSYIESVVDSSPIKNKHTGKSIVINKEGIKKQTSYIVNSLKNDAIIRNDHVVIASKLDDVIEKSVFLEVSKNQKDSKAGDFGHYYSEVSIEGRNYLWQGIVKEDNGSLYTWKLSRVSENAGAKVARPKVLRAGPASSLENSITPIEAKFNEARKNRYFQEDGPRAQIDFKDGESIVTLHKGADNTSVLHETGHEFLNNFEEIINSGKASKQTKTDWDTTQAWLNKQDYKAKKPDIDNLIKKLKEKGTNLKGKELRAYAKGEVEKVNRHEFFARGFETYMHDGSAPSERIARVFEKFKTWFRDLYSSREQLDADISPEMKDVYSRLMGGEKTYDIKGELPRPKVKLEAPKVEDDEFINLVESYSQGKLNNVDAMEIEQVMVMEKSTDEAIEHFKATGDFLTLFQGSRTEAATALAKELGITKGAADSYIGTIDSMGRLSSINDVKAKQIQMQSVIEQLTEGLEHQKALEKRNAALSIRAKKGLQEYVDKIITEGYKDQGAVKDFLNSNGTPERAILSFLEGDSRMRGVEGAGRAIYSDYQGLTQYWMNSMITDLKKIDPNIEKILSKDPSLNENIVREMWEIRGDGTGKPGISKDPKAMEIAKLFSKSAEENRIRLNEAGADIGKLDGWVPRQHDYEAMVTGTKGGWVDDSFNKLDLERSFPGVTDEKRIKEILEETYENLITGIHGMNDVPRAGDAIMPTPSNMAKRLGKNRILHFKDSASELAYLQKYSGGYNIVETMFRQMDNNARLVSVMERLGPNPDSTIYSVIEQTKRNLRKGTYGIDKTKVEKLASQLPNKQQLIAREGQIGNSMAVITGESSMVQNLTGAKVAGTIRAWNTATKLMGATLSQLGDSVSVANEMRIMKDQGAVGAWIDTTKAYLSKISPEQKSSVLDKLGIIGDGFNMASFNRFDSVDSLSNKLNRAIDNGFKLSGMTQLTNKIKSGFGLSLSKEFAENSSKSWDELGEGIREVLTQYGGIDSTKWDIVRSAVLTDVDGIKYFTPDSISKMDDDAFAKLLPEEMNPRDLSKTIDDLKGDKVAAKELKKVKKDLEQAMRTVFVEETRNAIIEPDARSFRTTTLGLKRGTVSGEAMRLMMQFKSFAITYTQRTLGGRRFMKNKDDYGGVVHHALMSTVMGYASMTAKDLAKGKEPRDASKANTWTAAMIQSGGLGIVGDLMFSDVNRFGGGVLATLAGPTAGIAEDVARITLGNAHKAARGDKTDFMSDAIGFAQYNLPVPAANLWYTRTALNHLFWYRLRETLNPGSMRRMERRIKKDNNQEYFWKPTDSVK
jgi:hypothetical protein